MSGGGSTGAEEVEKGSGGDLTTPGERSALLLRTGILVGFFGR